MILIRFLKLRPEHNHNPVLQEVIVLHWVGVKSLALEVMTLSDTVNCDVQAEGYGKTYSFSGRSTWKQMMSPSWISLCVKVSFGFMSSIMPGLISYKNVSFS